MIKKYCSRNNKVNEKKRITTGEKVVIRFFQLVIHPGSYFVHTAQLLYYPPAYGSRQ